MVYLPAQPASQKHKDCLPLAKLMKQRERAAQFYSNVGSHAIGRSSTILCMMTGSN